jgi:hypothetical protein
MQANNAEETTKMTRWGIQQTTPTGAKLLNFRSNSRGRAEASIVSRERIGATGLSAVKITEGQARAIDDKNHCEENGYSCPDDDDELK